MVWARKAGFTEDKYSEQSIMSQVYTFPELRRVWDMKKAEARQRRNEAAVAHGTLDARLVKKLACGKCHAGTGVIRDTPQFGAFVGCTMFGRNGCDNRMGRDRALQLLQRLVAQEANGETVQWLMPARV